MKFRSFWSIPLLVSLLLAGCAVDRRSPRLPATENHTSLLNVFSARGEIPAGARQALLVTDDAGGRSAAAVVSFERGREGWQQVWRPAPAMIGRSGFAPPGQKREGDGRTPSGIFALERAFGYGATAPTRLRYRQATAEDLWIDDVNSPDYNLWVRKGETSAASFEQMRRQDELYKYGLVVEYNTDPVVNGYGSAIFYHLWRGDGVPTAGCVALPEADLLRLLAWLDPAKQPVTIIGSDEILRGMAAKSGR